MFGIMIVGHARLADELVKATEHIMGPQNNLVPVSISPDDEPATRRQEFSELIQKLDQGNGVIILTDMFGGTPSNLAMSFLEPDRIEVIAGVNLPMVVKLVSLRQTHDLKKAAALAAEAARTYITVATSVLQTNEDRGNE